MGFYKYCNKCGCGMSAPKTVDYLYGHDCPACHDKTEFDLYEKVELLLHIQVEKEEAQEQQANGQTQNSINTE